METTNMNSPEEQTNSLGNTNENEQETAGGYGQPGEDEANQDDYPKTDLTGNEETETGAGEPELEDDDLLDDDDETTDDDLTDEDDADQSTNDADGNGGYAANPAETNS